jgi:hypothetical protein
MNERPEFVEKVSSRIRVYTPTVIIEGSHHHPPGVRLSDLLRNQAAGEKYMLLTAATLTAPDGVQSQAEYVLINTAHASVILTLDEFNQSPQEGAVATPVLPTEPTPPHAAPEKHGFGLGGT